MVAANTSGPGGQPRREHTPTEVHESWSFLEATVEAAADGILVVDRRGRVAFANQRFRAQWGLPPAATDTDEEKLVGLMLAQVEDPSAFRAGLIAQQAAPERQSKELVRLRDGRVLERQSRPQWVGGQIVSAAVGRRSDRRARVDLPRRLRS
jgi:PAS domain-containing protein